MVGGSSSASQSEQFFTKENLDTINVILRELHAKGEEHSDRYKQLVSLLHNWNNEAVHETTQNLNIEIAQSHLPLMSIGMCRDLKNQICICRDLLDASKTCSSDSSTTLSDPELSNMTKKWKVPNDKAKFEVVASFRKVCSMVKCSGIERNELIVHRDHLAEENMKKRREYLLQVIPTLTDSNDIMNATIECKALGLVSLQRKLRRKVLGLMKEDPLENSNFAPKNFKRNKKYQIRDLKSSLTYEKNVSDEMERNEKKKHEQFITSLLNHERQFREFHRNIQQKWLNVQKSILMHFNSNDREKRLEEERLEKERLRVLMTEDEEGYRKLLDEKKDRRLHYLFTQTDEYIKSLIELVRLQRQTISSDPCNSITMNVTSSLIPSENVEDKNKQTSVEEQSTPQVIAECELNQIKCEYAVDDDLLLKGNESIAPQVTVNNDDDDDDAVPSEDTEGEKSAPYSSASYYQMVHSISEVITEQPNSLVGGKLKQYQLRGLEWLVSLHNNHLNGILADEMGLGKTIQTISFVCQLVEKKLANGPFLIIVPLSTISNWQMEFEKWAPSLVCISYKGSQLNRRSLAQRVRNGRYHVLLTTYEYIMKDKSLLSKVGWWYLVVDEGHRMKNHDCKLNQTISSCYPVARRLLLTGTPLQNRLPELWSLLNFILPDIFHSCSTFEQWFNTPFANTNEKVELNEEETYLIIRRLHKVLRPFLLRRLKKEVESQLPDKVEYVLKCTMSGLQKQLYLRMRKTGHMFTLDDSQKPGNSSAINSRQLMNVLMQLRKICNHPFMFRPVEEAFAMHIGQESTIVLGPTLFRACGKVELLDRILPKMKRCGHRCLIFCQMTQTMSILEDYFTWKGFTYLRLDGTTKSEDRAQLLSLYNSPGSPYFLFLLSTRAGGLGLNLQSADTVIIYDSDWNPQQDLQAQDRAHRIGQKNEVRVLRLVTANSVEEKILMAARQKLNLDEKVIQAGMFNQSSTNSERKAFLEALLENDNSSVGDDQPDDTNEVPDDETINQMICRGDEEFEIFQGMDAERKRLEVKNYSQGVTDSWKSRLIQDHELPEWMLANYEKNSSSSDQMVFGRTECTVLNTSNMSVKDDVEWNESGTSNTGKNPNIRAESLRKRSAQHLHYSDNVDDDEWLSSIQDESAQPSIVSTKKMKKSESSQAPQPLQFSDIASEGKSTSQTHKSKGSRKKGKKSIDASSLLSERSAGGETRQQLHTKMNQLLKSLLKAENDNGRRVAEAFYQLPSQKVLPDYYQLIKNPIDIKRIERKLKCGSYETFALFQEDFDLMINNAQTYNMESSQIYQDAVQLKKVFINILNAISNDSESSINPENR